MNLQKGLFALTIAAAFSLNSVQAQGTKAPNDWMLLDQAKDHYQGVSNADAYAKLKAMGKKGKTIIVAVIDSGVDYMHEDLKDVMWTNPGEIPGNGKDDDKNGYIDDIHGWSFLGGKDGKNIQHETYEITREYARLTKKFAGKDPDHLSGDDKKEYAYFQKIKVDFEEKRADLQGQADLIEKFFAKAEKAFSEGAKALGKATVAPDDIAALKALKNKDLAETIGILERVFAQGITAENLKEQKEEITDQTVGGLKYGLNPDYNIRAEVIGDDPNDCRLETRFYGNNDVKGPDASHGTHVAGIIAAKRGNGVGMDGMADNVRIMSVRCVPDGDERDKDVANAIRYAVDNGASIINMSFGKGYASNKQYVDDAVKYAAKHDVLLVHAAGNDSDNNDTDANFPNDGYQKHGWFGPKNSPTWLEIGALSWKSGEKRVASFSNYGKKNVDLFSPGVSIYSTTPENHYASMQGTSMASPAAAGVAAIIRSYFPELSAKQVKKVLMGSVAKQEGKVFKPGTAELVPFSELCVTGGAINAATAVDAAAKTKGSTSTHKTKWWIVGELSSGKTVMP